MQTKKRAPRPEYKDTFAGGFAAACDLESALLRNSEVIERLTLLLRPACTERDLVMLLAVHGSAILHQDAIKDALHERKLDPVGAFALVSKVETFVDWAGRHLSEVEEERAGRSGKTMQ